MLKTTVNHDQTYQTRRYKSWITVLRVNSIILKLHVHAGDDKF